MLHGSPFDAVSVSACRRTSPQTTPPGDSDQFKFGVSSRVHVPTPVVCSALSRCLFPDADVKLHSLYNRTMASEGSRSGVEKLLLFDSIPKSNPSSSLSRCLNPISDPQPYAFQWFYALRVIGQAQLNKLRHCSSKTSMTKAPSEYHNQVVCQAIHTRDSHRRMSLSCRERYNFLTPFVLNLFNKLFSVNIGPSTHGIDGVSDFVVIDTCSPALIYRQKVPIVDPVCYRLCAACLYHRMVDSFTEQFVSVFLSRSLLDEPFEDWHQDPAASLIVNDQTSIDASLENHCTEMEEMTAADCLFRNLGRTCFLDMDMGFRPKKLLFVKIPSLSGHKPIIFHPLNQNRKLGLFKLYFMWFWLMLGELILSCIRNILISLAGPIHSWIHRIRMYHVVID